MPSRQASYDLINFGPSPVPPATPPAIPGQSSISSVPSSADASLFGNDFDFPTTAGSLKGFPGNGMKTLNEGNNSSTSLFGKHYYKTVSTGKLNQLIMRRNNNQHREGTTSSRYALSVMDLFANSSTGSEQASESAQQELGPVHEQSDKQSIHELDEQQATTKHHYQQSTNKHSSRFNRHHITNHSNHSFFSTNHNNQSFGMFRASFSYLLPVGFFRMFA